MNVFVITLQLVLALSVVGLILIQSKGTGLGRSFGGGSGASFKRRGLENVIFKSTFFVVAAFLLISIVNILI